MGPMSFLQASSRWDLGFHPVGLIYLPEKHNGWRITQKDAII